MKPKPKPVEFERQRGQNSILLAVWLLYEASLAALPGSVCGSYAIDPGEHAPWPVRFWGVVSYPPSLEVHLESSEVVPDNVIEEIANILANGYFRMVMAEARSQKTWPTPQITLNDNPERDESQGGRHFG